MLVGADLRAAGMHTLAEALREAAGVDVVANGAFAGGSASLRALGGGPEDVVVRWNGIPLGFGYAAADLANLTLDGVERIEVRRGAAVDLAGPGAEAMVIDVRTYSRMPSGRAIEASRGRDATVLGRGEGAARGRTWTATAAASGLRTEGGLGTAESYSRFALATGAMVGGGQGSYVRVAGTGTMSRYGFGGPDMGAPLPPSYGAVLDQIQKATATLVSLEAGTSLGERLAVRALLGRQARSDHYHNAESQPPSDSVVYDEIRRTRGFHNHYEVSAAYRFGPAILGSAGVEHDDAESEEKDTIAANGAFGWSSRWSRTRGTAVRLGLTGERGPWSLEMAVRRDDPKYGPAAITWRAVLARHLGVARVHLGARMGYRAPLVSEIPGEIMRNQSSRTLEAGLQLTTADGRIRTQAILVEQRIADVIGPFPVGVEFGPTPFVYGNAGVARARGWELALLVLPSSALRLGVTWSHLPMKAVSARLPEWTGFLVGQALPDRPSDLLVASATLRVGRGGLLDVRLRGVSERVVVQTSFFRVDTLPGYAVLDLGGRLPLAHWLQVTMRVENLLDRAYVERVGYPPRGRALSVGARLGSP